MNKNSTLFQIITSVGTKFVVLFGSFIMSIILARYLGPEGKGIIASIFVIPNLLISIADLGIRQATAYHVGKKIYHPNIVFTAIFKVWLITSIFSMLFAIVYYSTGSSELYGWNLLLIPIITIPFMLMNKYTEGMLLGLQQVLTINKKRLVGFVANLLFLFLFVVLLKLHVFGAALITLFVGVTTLAFSFYMLSNSVRFSREKEPKIISKLIKKGIVYAVALFILNLNYKIDIIFLERLSNSVEVGIYSIGVNLSELIWQIPAAMGMVLFSKSANSKLDMDAVDRATRLLRISWVPIIIITVLFWVFAPLFVPFVYGEEFIRSSEVIRLLLPGVLAMVLFKILNADLAGRGFPLFALKVYVIALIINIVANLILIPAYGANGAAIGSTISYSVGAILFSIAYYRKSKIKYTDMFILNKSDLKLVKSTTLKIFNKLKRRNKNDH